MWVNFVKVFKDVRSSTGLTCASGHFYQNTSVIIGLAILYVLLQAAVAAPPQNEDEWWKLPCSKPVPIRHGRSPQKLTYDKLLEIVDTSYLNIQAFYNNKQRRPPKGGQCLLKIGKLMSPIRQQKIHKEAVKQFYISTLEIAKFLNKLEATKVKTSAMVINMSTRHSIFEYTKGGIKGVLCEYMENEFQFAFPDQHRLKKFKINTKCISSSMDLTWLQVRDIDFFFKIKKFFKQSAKYLRRLKNRKAGQKKGLKKVKKV